MGICIDGFPFIGIALTLLVVLSFYVGVRGALPALLLLLFVTWFFRDPTRVGPEDSKAIISPADGKVIGIDKAKYPRLLSGEATRVSVFMSVFNVHVNRVPFSGTVRDVHYNPGKFFAAWEEKASEKNEQTTLLLDTEGGVPLLLVQIAGLIARRIICRVSPGDRVERGERYGLIRFGSRCDLYLPDSVAVEVKVGDYVKGGETVLGVFR